MDDIQNLRRGTIVPTTHLADYVTKNGYGNIVDRTQIVENDSMDTTIRMIDKVFDAYMDSLANIVIEYSPEQIKKLFMENLIKLDSDSQVLKKIEGKIEGYLTPEASWKEIAKQVKIDEQTTLENINAQIIELAKTICPFYIAGKGYYKYSGGVKIELRKLYPDCEALKVKKAGSGGCYVATAVYGSYDCPQVWTLRRYRDYTLSETWYGRAFIRTYYAISPTLVKWFGQTKWFKKMWKGKLDRMVSKLQSEGVENTPYEDKNW